MVRKLACVLLALGGLLGGFGAIEAAAQSEVKRSITKIAGTFIGSRTISTIRSFW